MKKRFLAMILALTMIVMAFAACSKDDGDKKDDKKDNKAAETKADKDDKKDADKKEDKKDADKKEDKKDADKKDEEKKDEDKKDADKKDEDKDKADKDGEAYKVGITLQSLENSYWAGVFGQVEDIMKDKGWEYTILSCRDNSATQIQQIENFITNKVNLIMVHPSDPASLEDYLKKAREEGIKVMVWDDIIENSDLNWVLNNADLGYAIGKAAADFINEHFSADNKAHVAVLNYPQTPILLDREKGIIKALEEVAKDKFEIVSKQPALDPKVGQNAMESIFQADPDVKIVCSIGAGGDIGANQAFLVKYPDGIPEDVGIFSADATQQQMEAIKKGEASHTSVGFEGSNKRTAIAVTDLYEKLLKGEKIEDKNLYRPLLPINKDNVDTYLADYEEN